MYLLATDDGYLTCRSVRVQPVDYTPCLVADFRTSPHAHPLGNREEWGDSERNPGLERAEGRLSKSAAFRRNPREYKAFRNEKGQPVRVGLVVLVEAAGIEPASVGPTPSVLHA